MNFFQRRADIAIWLLAGILTGAGTLALPSAARAGDGGEKAALQNLLETNRRQPDVSALLPLAEAFVSRYPQSEAWPQVMFLTGELRFDRRDYAGAFQSFAAVAGKPGPYAEGADYRCGECQFNQGRYDAALRHWQKLLPRAGTLLRPEVMLGVAQCHRRLGAWEDARRACEDLIRAYPSYRDCDAVRAVLGASAYYQRDYPKTLEWLDGVQASDALYFYGSALQQMKRLIQAADCFDRLIRRFPKDDVFVKAAVFEKAEIFYTMRHFEWAKSAYEYFLLGYPDDPLAPYAQYKLACIGLLGGKPDGARRRLEALAKSGLGGEAEQYVTYLRAEALVRLGRKQEAYNLYESIWNQTKQSAISADVLLKKAWLHLALGRYRKAQEALELYSRTFTTSPILAHIYFLLGNALFLQEEYQQAIKVYHDTILNFPYSKITDACLMQIQRGYQKLGLPDKLIAAASYILQVLEINFPPENETLRALCYFSLGEAYYQVRQYGSAIKHYQYILDHFAATPIGDLARESLAWSNFQDGNYPEANKIVAALLGRTRLDADVKKRITLLKAHCLFNLKKYKTATALYEAWLKAHPSDEQVPEALFGLSQSHMRTGQNKKSIEIMMRIVKRHQNSPLARRALLLIGNSYFNAEGYEQALQAYRLFIQNWPGDPQVQEIRLRIAHTLYNAGRIAQARTAYQGYLRQWPDGAYAGDARSGIELADWQETDQARTVDQYRKFLSQHPKSEFADLAQYRLGIHYFERKEPEDAIREFRALNYNYPGSQYIANSQYYLGLCFEKVNQIPETIRIYEQFIQNFSNHDLMPEVLSRLGEVRFRNGEYLDAAKTYRRILDQFPLPEYEANALYNIGVCYEQNKMWTEAIGSYQQFYAKFPTNGRAQQVLLHIGITYQQMQKYRLASEYLEKALPKARPDDLPELYYRLGNAYENLGQTEQAVFFYSRAQELKPAGNEYRCMALSQLGAMYEKQNKTREAIAVYRDICENSKNAQWRQLAAKRVRELERR